MVVVDVRYPMHIPEITAIAVTNGGPGYELGCRCGWDVTMINGRPKRFHSTESARRAWDVHVLWQQRD